MTVSRALRVRTAGALTSPFLIVWREHRLFLGVIAAYLAAAVLVDRTGLVPGLARTITYTKPYLLAPAIAWIPIFVTFFIDRFRVRDELGNRINGLAGWVASYRRGTISPERIARLVVISLAMALFLNTFGWWKSAIPILHPFSLDQALASLDQSLHFGRHPWQWLHPVLGWPAATRWIDGLYALWLALVPCAILWQGWSRDVRTQRQFFLAFVLTWIVLGTGLATIWSSAGPCYYERLLGDALPYGDLMRYLDGAPFTHDSLLARRAQEALWANYLVAGDNPFVRISAMPSIHVATTLLYALAARRSSRVLGLIALGYCLIILLGSIHLGWHYALDGEVSLLLVPPIWWLSGRLTAGDVEYPSVQPEMRTSLQAEGS
jgi:hypothetical protein